MPIAGELLLASPPSLCAGVGVADEAVNIVAALRIRFPELVTDCLSGQPIPSMPVAAPT